MHQEVAEIIASRNKRYRGINGLLKKIQILFSRITKNLKKYLFGS